MDFRICTLDVEQFQPLFGLDQPALAELGAQRIVVDGNPGVSVSCFVAGCCGR